MGALGQNGFFILAAAMLVGFIALSVAVMRLRSRMKKMWGGTEPSGDAVRDLVVRLAHAEARIEEMMPRLAAAAAEASAGIQKVGFVRFNPFQDTGGDNSFIIVLLDSYDTGVVISSLYMRDGARLYAKAVERGSAKHPLSDEERTVLADTLQKHPL